VARILYPSAEAVISTGQKRVLSLVITFFNNRLGSLSWAVFGGKRYEIFGRSNDGMSKVRTLVTASPSVDALGVIFEIFRDFLQLPSVKCWDLRTYLKGSRHYALLKQELLVDASWSNGLGFNTRPFDSFGLIIPSREIMGF
jgi:hypothetical protein